MQTQVSRVAVVVDNRGFVRCGAPAAAALSMLGARPCPSSLGLPPTFAFELAILCALLGLRLAVLGCMLGRGGRTGIHARICIFSSSVSHVESESKSKSKSNTITPSALFMLRRLVPSY